MATLPSFGRYELLLKMASGGMATLYLARITGPEKFEKLLCIKKIHDHLADDREFTEMFLDECRIAALIHHPNVATVFEMGRVDASYFMALEYVHGHDLREVLAAAKRLPDSMPWAYAARIVADAAAGLHAAHELRRPGGAVLGVVHRDVSHQNLLISYDGHVKVVDFGIAYARERISHTAVKTLKGKVAYMSPEQASQKSVDRRSDVFSLGILLYEAITLKRLFKANTEVDTLLRVREARVPRPRSVRPELPARLEEIVLKALAPDPEDRYQTAAQLQGVLEALLVEERQVAGQQQIADLMDRLFHGPRLEKDRRIQIALSTGAHDDFLPLRMGSREDSDLSRVSEVRGLGAWLRDQRWILVGGLGGAALVVAAMLLAFFMGRWRADPPPANLSVSGTAGNRGNPDDRHDPRRAIVHVDAGASLPPPRKVEEPATVRVEIRVLPKRARPRIRFRERTHQGSVFRAQVPRSSSEDVVKISARGYRSQSLLVVLSESQSHTVTLERQHRSMRPAGLKWKTLPD